MYVDSELLKVTILFAVTTMKCFKLNNLIRDFFDLVVQVHLNFLVFCTYDPC